MEINVYSQYFEAKATFSGVKRRGALVLLETLRGEINALAAANGASVDWTKPLGEARLG